MRRSIALASPFVILTAAANTQTRVGTAAGTCGRECLRGFVAQYPDAMIRHDPKAIPTAPTARFTEDTKTLPLGEGFRIAAVDEEMGIVLFRLDFGNTGSYGPGNALTLFEAFKIKVQKPKRDHSKAEAGKYFHQPK
jgi:hypothetical protein